MKTIKAWIVEQPSTGMVLLFENKPKKVKIWNNMFEWVTKYEHDFCLNLTNNKENKRPYFLDCMTIADVIGLKKRDIDKNRHIIKIAEDLAANGLYEGVSNEEPREVEITIDFKIK